MYKLKNDVEYIKIHGLQRSGTNYVQFLLNENLETEVLANIGGWKHGPYCFPWSLYQEVHIIVVVKNPYYWLFSLYNYWKEKKLGMNLENCFFNQFLRSNTFFEQGKGIPCLYRASNPVQYWNNMNFHWCSIRMNTKKLLIIPYEAALENPEEIVNLISEELKINKKTNFKLTTKKLEPNGEKYNFGEDFDRSIYEKKKYLEFFDNESIEFVNNELDKELMNLLRYNYENNRSGCKHNS